MEKLSNWLKRRGFDLERERGAEDCVCFSSSTVFIDASASQEAQLATLLHECGHVDVLQERLKNKRLKVAGATLGRWARTSNSRSRRALRVRISVVTEEIEAWDRGEALARRLKIRFNRRTFDNVRTRALMTYFRWTAQQKRGR